MMEFTKEQLTARIERQIDIAATIIERLGDDSSATSELAVETATMDIKILDFALAALKAGMELEPVAWIVHAHGGDQLTTDGGYVANAEGMGGIHSTPLYAAPQLPQPAVMTPNYSQFLSDVMTAAGLLSHGKRDKALATSLSDFCIAERMGMDAPCRAAMLQGAEPVQRWIPCSERIPEVDWKVLANVKSPAIEYQCLAEIDENGRWWDEYADQLPSSFVTHWQPLPAAPQQEVKP